MASFGDKCGKFTINLLEFIYSLIKLIILAKFNIKLKKTCNNNSIIILGNGPSLSITLNKHKEILVKNTTMAVNNFAASEWFTVIKPSYYILTTPEYWINQNTDPYLLDMRTNAISNIIAKTNWDMVIYANHNAKKSSIYQELLKNKHITICTINDNAFEGFTSIAHYFWKMKLGGPRFHNVLLPSILIAINLKYNNIYITGADHSWHEEIKVDESNNFTLNHQHFYDKKEVMIGQYKLDGNKYCIHDSFRKLYLAFKGHHDINNYAKKMNCKVLNASEKSYIDAYEQYDLSNLL